MTGFVGDNPDKLPRMGAFKQQSGVKKQLLSAGDKGVKGFVVDQKYLDGRRLQPGGPEQWRCVIPDGIFYLRVPDEG